MRANYRNPPIVLLALTAALGLSGCGDSKEAVVAKAEPGAAENQPKAGQAGASEKHDEAARADHEGHEQSAPISLSDEQIKAAGIVVEQAKEHAVSEKISVTATIQPNQDRLARVAPRIAGRVVRVAANLGDRVKAGQTLAWLDSVELGQAYSEYLKARTESELTRANFERAQTLQEQQVIAQKDYLRAQSEYETARAAVNAARGKLILFGVTPSADAQEAISVFPLQSPFNGTVIEKDAVIGELNQPDKAMFTIADLSTLWIQASVPEIHLARLRVGAEADVSVAAYPKERFRGYVTYIGGVLDRETRTVTARVEVKNAAGRLKPEMFATVVMQGEAIAKELALPQEAVVLLSGKPTVFVAGKEGFEQREIAIGEAFGDRVSIVSGLRVGERVVVAGAYALKAQTLKSQLGEGHEH